MAKTKKWYRVVKLLGGFVIKEPEVYDGDIPKKCRFGTELELTADQKKDIEKRYGTELSDDDKLWGKRGDERARANRKARGLDQRPKAKAARQETLAGSVTDDDDDDGSMDMDTDPPKQSEGDPETDGGDDMDFGDDGEGPS
jgi:hypothetical protein